MQPHFIRYGRGPSLEVFAFNAFPIKDELRAVGFKWDAARGAWRKRPQKGNAQALLSWIARKGFPLEDGDR